MASVNKFTLSSGLIAFACVSMAQKPPIVEAPWVYTAKNANPAQVFEVTPTSTVTVVQNATTFFDITSGDVDTFQGYRRRNNVDEYKDETFRDNASIAVNAEYDLDFFNAEYVQTTPATNSNGEELRRLKLTAKPLPSGMVSTEIEIYFTATDTVNNTALRDTTVSLTRVVKITRS